MKKDKKYKTIIILFSMLVVIFVVANVTTYAIAKKNLFDYFLSEEEELDEVWEMLQKDGKQSVVIDDYTITLEEYLYDGATYKGFVTFSVKREGKDMRDEIAGETVLYGVDSTFGENERFTFEVNGSLTCDTIYKKEKDVMYVYYEFDVGEVWGFDNRILLCDYKTHGSDWRKEENAMLEFCLNDNVGTAMYEMNNNGIKSHMYISPFAIKIVSFNPIVDIENLVLVFEDDSKEIIVDKNEIKIGEYYATVSNNGSYAYYIWLKEDFDTENIKEVALNDNCLKKLDDTQKEEIEKSYDKILEVK
ncbi:MAG: DUF4179 domain-containing protein [Lachnospiraceae bacterium]|nr:DUF4179 domain-containing protein [Lachnospiraceae bacterium]